MKTFDYYESITSFIKFKVLHSVVKYKIADLLVDGPLTIEEISLRSSTQLDNLKIILNYLIQIGIFEKKDDKIYNNNNSIVLIYNKEKSLAPSILYHGDEIYNSFVNFDKILDPSQDKKPFQITYNYKNIWDWYDLPENKIKKDNFNNYMSSNLIIINYNWKKYYGMKILDVGGNKGQYFNEVLKKYPDLDVTILDKFDNIEIEQINIENNNKNINFISFDFFKHIPNNYDIYFLRWILHDWSDEKVLIILKNIRKSISKNGILLISEQILNNDIYTLNLDIKMRTIFNGKERTIEQFKILFEKSKFEMKNIFINNNNHAMIEAMPK